MVQQVRLMIGLQHFSVSLSPLGTNWDLELFGTWLGLGLGVFKFACMGKFLRSYRLVRYYYYYQDL